MWGVDDENGISESDAISALNTQLLAGEGPDVIIMDGLNVGSYEDTGVLMELSNVYDDILQENPDCLENVLNAYRNSDGNIYAIPAMETFTAIIGPENEIKNVTDARSLAAYISSQDRPKYGMTCRFIIGRVILTRCIRYTQRRSWTVMGITMRICSENFWRT